MVIENAWVAIDPNTNRVKDCFHVKAVENQDWAFLAPLRVEPYDPDVHPPLGFDVEVGPDWKARYELVEKVWYDALLASLPKAPPVDQPVAPTDNVEQT